MAASAAPASPTALTTVMGDGGNGGDGGDGDDGGIAAMAAETVMAAQAAMATQACRPAIDLPACRPINRPAIDLPACRPIYRPAIDRPTYRLADRSARQSTEPGVSRAGGKRACAASAAVPSREDRGRIWTRGSSSISTTRWACAAATSTTAWRCCSFWEPRACASRRRARRSATARSTPCTTTPRGCCGNGISTSPSIAAPARRTKSRARRRAFWRRPPLRAPASSPSWRPGRCPTWGRRRVSTRRSSPTYARSHSWEASPRAW